MEFVSTHTSSRTLRILAVALAFILSPSALLAADELTIDHQATARQYLLHRSSGAGDSPRPLVVYLHGLRPADWKNHTRSEIDAAADREGFVTAYPAALERRWNLTGQFDEPVRIQGNVVDDVGFIGKLMDELVGRRIADPARIYVIGDSRGGMMTFELMCRMADRIAAAGPLITGMTDRLRDACKPAPPVPVLAVAGRNDNIQAYDGWLSEVRRLLSIPETMEFWRVQHGCTGQTRRLLPHRNQSDTTRLALVEWTGCKTPNAVKLYVALGGGHQVPSFTPVPADWVRQAGPQNQDIETIDEFWKFARQFSR